MRWMEIPDFSKCKILVVGDVILDRYCHGAINRISPEAPVPILQVQEFLDKPGGAGNVSMNLAALGCQVSLLGLIGKDEAGNLLQHLLQANAIDSQLIAKSELHTIVKLRVLGQHQQLIRLDFERKFGEEQQRELLAKFAESLPGIDLVILSDYAKGTLGDPQQFIQLARQAKVPILVDPKNQDFGVYRGATILTPNLKEFVQAAGECADDEALVQRGIELSAQHEFEAILLTRSEKGMLLIHPGHPPLPVPADAKDVFDVTGAGDTVIAVLGAALAAQSDLNFAVILANTAAGIVVGKLGAAAVNIHELRRALHTPTNDVQFCIMNHRELQYLVEDARAHEETIVMTNGCFDILHAGHVQYLQQAKSLGDRLIVAVNDDESIKKIKGPGRPINCLADRMKVLAALKFVDWVVPFAEETPREIISIVKPDVLVKGGDYKPDEVVGREIVEEYGGKVIVLDLFQSNSTTTILQKIAQEIEKV